MGDPNKSLEDKSDNNIDSWETWQDISEENNINN